VSHIFPDTIGDEQVLESVIIKIAEKGTPAPVCAVWASILSNLSKMSTPVVQVKHIPGTLVVKPGFLTGG